MPFIFASPVLPWVLAHKLFTSELEKVYKGKGKAAERKKEERKRIKEREGRRKINKMLGSVRERRGREWRKRKYKANMDSFLLPIRAKYQTWYILWNQPDVGSYSGLVTNWPCAFRQGTLPLRH